MFRLPSSRWLALVLIAAILTVAYGGGTAHAAPSSQATVEIVVFSYVDVAGNDDPNFPACNLQFDDEDEDYAMQNPLPSHTFVLQDGAGSEIERPGSVAGSACRLRCHTTSSCVAGRMRPRSIRSAIALPRLA